MTINLPLHEELSCYSKRWPMKDAKEVWEAIYKLSIRDFVLLVPILENYIDLTGPGRPSKDKLKVLARQILFQMSEKQRAAAYNILLKKAAAIDESKITIKPTKPVIKQHPYKERIYIKPEDYKETPGIVYRPCVKYGSNGGYDYLSDRSDGTYGLVMLKDNAAVFKTVAAAKEVVQAWCEHTRQLMSSSPFPIHSGKAWDQTRKGAWKFEAIQEETKPKVTTQYKF